MIPAHARYAQAHAKACLKAYNRHTATCGRCSYDTPHPDCIEGKVHRGEYLSALAILRRKLAECENCD